MTIGELVGYVTLDARQFMTGLRRVDAVVMQNQQTMRRLGVGMVAVSAALSVALSKVVKASVEFEKEMRRVNTIMLLSDRALTEMSEHVKDLGVEFGRMPTDLARGLYDIGSASFYGSEGMLVLRASARAAVAGMTTTKTAADALTTVLNAYGKSADEAADVSDTLFTAVKFGKITFEELSQNIGQAATTAALAGVPFEEVAAAFATITRAGIDAAETGTAINRALLSFIKPMDKARQVAAEYGIELNATALQSKGLSGAMDELVQRFAITEQQLDRIIATTESEAEAMEVLADESGAAADAIASIFPNVRALRAILPLLRQGGREFAGDLENMANKAGNTEEAFAQMQKTVAQNWERFKASWESLKDELAIGLLPMLKNAVELLTDTSETVRAAPQPIKTLVTAFTALVAAGLAVAGGAITLRLAFKGLMSVVSPAVRGVSALAGAFGVLVVALGAAALGAGAFLVGVVNANKEAEKLNETIKRQNEEAKELGEELTKMPDVLSAGWRMRLAGQRAAGYFGIPTGDFINKVYDTVELREERLAQLRAERKRERANTEEAEKEAARAVSVRTKALKDLGEAEKALYQDDSYKEYMERVRAIQEQAQRLYERLLGGPKRYNEVMRAIRAGDEAAIREAKEMHEKAQSFANKAYVKARTEYEATYKADIEQEKRERVAKWEATERKKLSLSELYADYFLRTGQITFDQYVARIQGIIESMRRVDAEREKVGEKPMFDEEIIRQELALFEKQETHIKNIREEAEQQERDRVQGARRVIAALQDQDNALQKLLSTQEELVSHALEMGDITEAEYARNIGHIINLMRRADREREKYSQPPMFLERTWALYEQLYRRQINVADELARIEEERFDNELAHIEKITGLKEQILDIELDVRDRVFRRRMAQVRLEYDDRESREDALAKIQREHAAAILKDVTDDKVTDVRTRLAQLDQAVGLLESAAEAGEDVGRMLDDAYKLIDINLAVQKEQIEAEIAAARRERELDDERFQAQREGLEKTLASVADVLDKRMKGSATVFFDELSARIKDLGKVFLREMGKVAIPAGGRATAQAAGGAGSIVINMAGGVGVGASERDLIRRVRDALTEELQRARS